MMVQAERWHGPGMALAIAIALRSNLCGWFFCWWRRTEALVLVLALAVVFAFDFVLLLLLPQHCRPGSDP